MLDARLLRGRNAEGELALVEKFFVGGRRRHTTELGT